LSWAVVLGDRLHVCATTKTENHIEQAVKELAKEIRLTRSAEIPVAWIVPTTINTNALLTQKQMNSNT
jgi:N-methylhydantoinase A/oxoprolinase/acetone carboxylase beta subunit